MIDALYSQKDVNNLSLSRSLSLSLFIPLFLRAPPRATSWLGHLCAWSNNREGIEPRIGHCLWLMCIRLWIAHITDARAAAAAAAMATRQNWNYGKTRTSRRIEDGTCESHVAALAYAIVFTLAYNFFYFSKVYFTLAGFAEVKKDCVPWLAYNWNSVHN